MKLTRFSIAAMASTCVYAATFNLPLKRHLAPIHHVRRTIYSEPLAAAVNVYYTTLQVGTPPVEHLTMLDTGSSVRFSACGCVATLAHNLTPGFAATYRNANWTSVPQQSGLLGLAWSSLARSNSTPFVENLWRHNLLDEPLFAMAFISGQDNNTVSNDIGFLTIGGTNASQYTGDIRYFDSPTNSSTEGFWGLTIDDLTLSGKSLNLSSKIAILDSGTNDLTLPSSVVQSVYAAIPGAFYSTQFAVWAYPCNETVELAFIINGTSFAFNPADFDFNGASVLGYCAGGILDGGEDPTWILGSTFMQSWYSVFRFDPPSIGLAPIIRSTSNAATNSSIDSSTRSGSSTATSATISQTANSASQKLQRMTAPEHLDRLARAGCTLVIKRDSSPLSPIMSIPILTPGIHRPSGLVGLAYGADALNTSLPKFLDDPAFPKGKVLLLTGNSLSKTDLLERIKTLLGDRLGGVFTSIGQHSPVQGIDAALEEVRRIGAVAIVAFGGGSVVDAGKVISYRHNEKYGSYLPELAIPTTLSVAECTSVAGYTNEKGDKTGYSDANIAPMFIIYDPELTLKTPERLWLSTGMRAVDHAVEMLYRPYASPVSKELALSSIHNLFKYLRISKAHPEDLNVRATLQVAAWESLGNAQIPSAFGLSHSLGHALGATYSIPHGITSCLTLGSTVKLLSKHTTLTTTEQNFLLRAILRINPASPSSGPMPTAENAGELLGEAIVKLVEDLGLKTSLSEWKVPEDDLVKIAKGSVGGLPGWSEEKKPSEEKVETMLRSLI
ncbi:hypothetical protein P7C70_g3384, partial [Phenoliferia sp. Uapishka_3]